MNLSYFQNDEPRCWLDVYQVDDENVWVECRLKQTFRSLLWGIPVLIVILTVIMYFFNDYFNYAVGICTALYIGSVIYYLFFLGPAARMQHRVAMLELKTRMDAGMTRAEALKNLQEESLKKAEIEQSQRNTMINASSNAAGLFSIARSIGKKN